MSWDAIEAEAGIVRNSLGCVTPFFPVIEGLHALEALHDMLEVDFEFCVEDPREMKADGETCVRGSFIKLRGDVYDDACNRDGRARFTAAHEMGHFYLHTNLPMMRMMEPAQNYPFYKLSEPQANQFAASILMPIKFITLNDSPEDLVERFGVSLHAAKNRLNYLKKKGYLYQKHKQDGNTVLL